MEQQRYDEFIKHHGDNYVLYHGIDVSELRCTLNDINYVPLDCISNTFFDMIKVLNGAREMHFLDSVWAALVYHLNAKYGLCKDIKITVYAKRGYHSMYNSPVQLSNWTIN